MERKRKKNRDSDRESMTTTAHLETDTKMSLQSSATKALNMQYLICSSLQHPLEVDSVVPILQIRRLRLREVSSTTERIR